jgi:hypothetical protein
MAVDPAAVMLPVAQFAAPLPPAEVPALGAVDGAALEPPPLQAARAMAALATSTPSRRV